MKASGKCDPYQMVTDRFIEALEAAASGEEDALPWRRTWAGFPYNGDSGRPYHGINVVILWDAALRAGYDNPVWMTFQGAKRHDGHVAKGEKATWVVLWRRARCSKAALAERRRTDPDDDGSYLLIKTFPVWNVRQTTVPLENIAGKIEEKRPNVEQVVERLVREEGLEMRPDPNRCYYHPKQGHVALPAPEMFDSRASYYRTLLHELVHWTGPRVGRTVSAERDENYAFEELVAEIGSAMLASVLGVDGEDVNRNAIAYVRGWLKALRGDKKFVFQAAARAREAATFILGSDPLSVGDPDTMTTEEVTA